MSGEEVDSRSLREFLCVLNSLNLNESSEEIILAKPKVDVLLLLLQNVSIFKQMKLLTILDGKLSADECLLLTRGLNTSKSLLTHINFSRNKLGDTGVLALAKLVSELNLQSIDLSSNGIGDLGIQSLTTSLIDNSTLISLSLASNSFGCEGFEFISKLLKLSQSIQKLSIYGNELNLKGAGFLSEAISSNFSLITLDIGSCSFNEQVSQQIFIGLGSSKKLENIYLYSNNINDKCCLLLKENIASKPIKSIDLSMNEIGNLGACLIAEAFMNSKTLISLDLSSNLFGYKGFHSVARCLESCPRFESIYLSGNYVNDGENILQESLLFQNSSLQILDLGGTNLGDLGIESMSKSLGESTKLHTLYLYGNDITAKGMQHLLIGLSGNTSLHTLDLGSNNIGSKGAEYLSKILDHNIQISNLQLYGNNIADDGMLFLIPSLKINDRLEILNLGVNNIGSEGVKLLSSALGSMKIKTLLLYSNVVAIDGIKYLAEALYDNECLEILNLGCTKLGTPGFKCLSELLKQTKVLKSMYAYNNSILLDQYCFKAISNMSMLKCLSSLDLGGNQLGNEGAKRLMKSFKHNPSLISYGMQLYKKG